ncbi:MAG: acylphosphatase [Candidatus Nanopelagicales bacterium]
MSAANSSPQSVRLTARVSGYVQGVGFRWYTRAMAREFQLVGWAENLFDGDVEVVAEGPSEACLRLLNWLNGQGPRSVRVPGRVDSVSAEWGSAKGGLRDFSIR